MRKTEKGPRIRVVGLVFCGSDILVVEHRSGDQRWLCFPGGRMKFGETPEQCLTRELGEELRMPCKIGPLSAVGSYLGDKTHNIEMFFRCDVETKSVQISSKEITQAFFVSMKSRELKHAYPFEVSADLAQHGIGFFKKFRYYGQFR